jgi:hypothetical protein
MNMKNNNNPVEGVIQALRQTYLAPEEIELDSRWEQRVMRDIRNVEPEELRETRIVWGFAWSSALSSIIIVGWLLLHGGSIEDRITDMMLQRSAAGTPFVEEAMPL